MQALAAVLQHERAAEFAMSTGVLDVLLKGMQSNGAHKRESERRLSQTAAGPAANAVAALVSSSAARAQAFFTAGGLDVIDAAFHAFSEAALHGAVIQPRATPARQQFLALPQWETATKRQQPTAMPASWWDYTTSRPRAKPQAQVLLSNPLCAWKVPTPAAPGASTVPLACPHLPENTDPCKANCTVEHGTLLSEYPLRHVPALKLQGIQAFCHLISALSRVSLAMQTRIGGTRIIRSMVRS
jgi:hypothetical protein